MGRKSGGEKRNHSATIPRPPVSLSTVPKNSLRLTRDTNRNLEADADRRLGASREIPIILDGDSAKSVTSGKSNPRMHGARGSPELILRDISPMMADIPFIKSPGDRYGATSSEEKDMTLVDIDDFEMRKKVAQLMAVAPALPVRDLYHLIIDSEGRLSKARKKAIRMSEAPAILRTTTQLSLQPRTLTNNSDTEGFIVNISDSDTPKATVKIEPSDPVFKWDEDEPAPEPPPMMDERRTEHRSEDADGNEDRSVGSSGRTGYISVILDALRILHITIPYAVREVLNIVGVLLVVGQGRDD
ncbi:hypothetical protein J3E72DRAFT_430371 [Bipolaris maydis]|nr:hypothetical protein J3E72DRAFT_430371 [Bipolaris maydis]